MCHTTHKQKRDFFGGNEGAPDFNWIDNITLDLERGNAISGQGCNWHFTYISCGSIRNAVFFPFTTRFWNSGVRRTTGVMENKQWYNATWWKSRLWWRLRSSKVLHEPPDYKFTTSQFPPFFFFLFFSFLFLLAGKNKKIIATVTGGDI